MTKIAIIQRPPVLLDRSATTPEPCNRSLRLRRLEPRWLFYPNRSFQVTRRGSGGWRREKTGL